jgi:hypothetical protein
MALSGNGVVENPNPKRGIPVTFQGPGQQSRHETLPRDMQEHHEMTPAAPQASAA